MAVTEFKLPIIRPSEYHPLVMRNPVGDEFLLDISPGVMKWLNEQADEEWSYFIDIGWTKRLLGSNRLYMKNITIIFKNAPSATLFKLTWL